MTLQLNGGSLTYQLKWARYVRRGQGRAGQGRAGQGRAGQGMARQGRVGQGRAGQALGVEEENGRWEEGW